VAQLSAAAGAGDRMGRIESFVPVRGWICAIAIGVVGLTSFDAARAELFRCSGPDGDVIFTDDASVCPGAEPFEAKKQIHTVQSGVPASQGDGERAAAEQQRRMLERAESGEAALWKAKQQQAQYELRAIEHYRDRLDGLVAWCNQGGRVVTYDDAGIKQSKNCAELKEELTQVEARVVALSDYVERGLAEECRKAGCLPGWLR